MIEKRLSERKKVNIMAKYISENNNTNLFNSSVIYDVSNCGFCLIVREKLTIGENIKMRFYIPGTNNFIQIKGEIIWISELLKNSQYKGGIKLIDINPEQKLDLNNWVNTDL